MRRTRWLRAVCSMDGLSSRGRPMNCEASRAEFPLARRLQYRTRARSVCKRFTTASHPLSWRLSTPCTCFPGMIVASSHPSVYLKRGLSYVLVVLEAARGTGVVTGVSRSPSGFNFPNLPNPNLCCNTPPFPGPSPGKPRVLSNSKPVNELKAGGSKRPRRRLGRRARNRDLTRGGGGVQRERARFVQTHGGRRRRGREVGEAGLWHEVMESLNR